MLCIVCLSVFSSGAVLKAAQIYSLLAQLYFYQSLSFQCGLQFVLKDFRFQLITHLNQHFFELNSDTCIYSFLINRQVCEDLVNKT